MASNYVNFLTSFHTQTGAQWGELVFSLIVFSHNIVSLYGGEKTTHKKYYAAGNHEARILID